MSNATGIAKSKQTSRVTTEAVTSGQSSLRQIRKPPIPTGRSSKPQTDSARDPASASSLMTRKSVKNNSRYVYNPNNQIEMVIGEVLSHSQLSSRSRQKLNRAGSHTGLRNSVEAETTGELPEFINIQSARLSNEHTAVM